MRLSTKGKYGLRAMIDLAMYYSQGQITLSSIAARQNIPESYLEQLLNLLKKAGLVSTIRGSQGGYILTKKPQEITVGMILIALEGSLAPVEYIDDHNLACNHTEICATRFVWDKLKEGIEAIVNSITLGDLVDKQRELYQLEEVNKINSIQAPTDDFKMIVLDYLDDTGTNRKLVFNGKWLLKNEPGKKTGTKEDLLYSVALTEKGQFFISWQQPNLPQKIEYIVSPSLEKLEESKILPPEMTIRLLKIFHPENNIMFLDI